MFARGSGVVPYEAHNLVTPVQIRPPQHFVAPICAVEDPEERSAEGLRSSVAERGFHKAEVAGSTPAAATQNLGL